MIPSHAKRHRSRVSSASLAALARDEKGATLMEYIMLAGLVAIAAFAGFKLFGTDIQNAISGQANSVQSIPTSAQ